MFEIDDEGWIAQQRGREPWELVREIIQNALDTETDIVVNVDTRKRKVVVKDNGEFENLQDAYTIFGGDKGSDPTKRGRWGRGLKEVVGGAEKVIVMSPEGRVKFDVPNRERTEDDLSTRSGTKVVVSNSEWSKEQMDGIKEYLFKLWPPEGQSIQLSLKGGSLEERDRWQPHFETRMRLKTVIVENGVMTTEDRRGEVHIRKAEGGEEDGRVYEMGIPVTMDKEFPYWVDVQQKIPMAEQRNEPDSEWMNRFEPKLLNTVIDDLSDRELRASWVEEALAGPYCNVSTRREFAERVLQDEDKAGTVTRGAEAANDKCRNHGYQVLDTSKLSRGASRAAKNAFSSAEDVAKQIHESQEERVEPTEEQEEFIEFAKEIATELGHGHVRFETWEIQPSFNGDMPVAMNAGGLIKLNTVAHDWEEVNQDTLGTVVHEISHEVGEGHSETWYNHMQDNFARLLMEHADF